MAMKSKTFGLVLISFLSTNLYAQNTRIRDNNTVGWFNNFTTIKFSKKWSGHVEYQWRRESIIKDWLQSLLRVGINYQANPKLQLRNGYAWIETFAYGDIPVNSFGKKFTEHRLYEMATITDKISIVDLSHRFMLEQRWVGRYSNAGLSKEDDYLFLNRLRYMYRMQVPLKGKTIADKTAYAAIYDEVFLGFGKNVNENVFDQNRLGILLGYKLNKNFRAEAGYFNQILQLGREVNNKNVFQYNSGVILNTYINVDLSKK